MMDEMMPRITQADAPSTDPPHELMAVIVDLQARVTKLEARDTSGLLGKLFGKSTVAALLLAMLISGPVWAQQPTPYYIYGAGLKSCGHWLEMEKEDEWPRTVLKQWLHGYVTAYDRWVGLGNPVSDGQGFVAWIDNYCQDNPLEKVGAAAEQLVYELKVRSDNQLRLMGQTPEGSQ